MNDVTLESLQSLISTHFPQYGKPQCNILPVEDENNNTGYKAKIMLFDQMMMTTRAYPSRDEAVEAIARLAHEALSEFISIKHKSVPENIKQVLEIVDNGMHSFVDGKDLPMSFSRVEAIDGLEEEVKIERLSEQDFKPAHDEKLHPVNYIYQIASKCKLTPPDYDFFEQSGRHGCKLSFNGAVVTVLASYTQKAEAKLAVAKLLCEQMYNNLGVQFSGPSVTKVEVREKGNVAESQGSDCGIDLAVDDRNNVCKLNLVAQKNGVKIIPYFKFIESDQPKGYFKCNYDGYGFSVQTTKFSKKSVAKEECARLCLEKFNELYFSQSLKLSSYSFPTSSIQSQHLLAPSNSNQVIKGTESLKTESSKPEKLLVSVQTPFQQPIQPPSLTPSVPSSNPMGSYMPYPFFPPQHMPFYPPYMGMWPHQMMNYASMPMNQQSSNSFPGPVQSPNTNSPILPPGSLLMMPGGQMHQVPTNPQPQGFHPAPMHQQMPGMPSGMMGNMFPQSHNIAAMHQQMQIMNGYPPGVMPSQMANFYAHPSSQFSPNYMMMGNNNQADNGDDSNKQGNQNS